MASKKTSKSSSKKVSGKKQARASKSAPNRTEEKHTKKRYDSERNIALEFASKVHEKFDTLVKATILFGSQAKHQSGKGSDIDVIIVVDDAAVNWDLELIAWYREELARIISANKRSRDLHVNTIRLTTWWHDLMLGDPVVINILRYGEVLIDIGGFFNPLKALLLQGRIHSTAEAVYISLQRAPSHLARSRASMLNSIEGIYWAMIDSAHATLMTLGKLPPSPEHLPGMLSETFVEKKLLNPRYVSWLRDIHSLHKKIAHRETHSVAGSEVDAWQSRASEFIKKMTEIIDRIIGSRKK